MKRVDFGGAIFSEVTDELIATVYDDDKTPHYFKDKAFEADYKLARREFPATKSASARAPRDEQLWLVTANSDTEPGETYLFDRKREEAHAAIQDPREAAARRISRP